MRRKDKIVEMARKMAGTDITVRPDDVDAILEAGWDGIKAGTVVYKDRIQDATKIYTKASDNEISANGKKVTITEAQKNNMVDTYALISIIGPKG